MTLDRDGGDLRVSRQLVVSQRLRERRRTLGLTQNQVVTRLARLGTISTNKALSSLEHGAGLDVTKLPELARALDCSVTWLLGLTDDPVRWEPDGAPAGATHHAETPHAPPTHSRRAMPESWILGPLSQER